MGRTLRAALLAAFIAFASVAGLGLFLGFPTVGSLVAGGVAAVLAALLLWGAARRADTFHAPDEATPLPPRTPGFPGPPDRPDGRTPEDPRAGPPDEDPHDRDDPPGDTR
jgi:hypothetical protein